MLHKKHAYKNLCGKKALMEDKRGKVLLHTAHGNSLVLRGTRIGKPSKPSPLSICTWFLPFSSLKYRVCFNSLHSPAFFKILKEPTQVLKLTIPHMKALILSYLEPEDQGRGILMGAPRLLPVKCLLPFLSEVMEAKWGWKKNWLIRSNVRIFWMYRYRSHCKDGFAVKKKSRGPRKISIWHPCYYWSQVPIIAFRQLPWLISAFFLGCLTDHWYYWGCVIYVWDTKNQVHRYVSYYNCKCLQEFMGFP